MASLAALTLAGLQTHGADACSTSDDCPEFHLCIRDGVCRRIHTPPELSTVPLPHSLPAECLSKPWPEVRNCAKWYVNGSWRVLESNNVPPFYVPPYCPFGRGEGYCASPAQGNSTDCAPFMGLTCPCVPKNSTVEDPPGPGGGINCPEETGYAGDVMVPVYQHFHFPLHPDPTDRSKPKHMYDNDALSTGNTYQVIGAHLSGIQLKGPAEANGFNVDTSLIPLPCGGHVTPPVGPGPVYHFHKSAECMAAEYPISRPAHHGPIIGYAADGFAIHGYGDVTGEPLLDECHGHFGPTDTADPLGSVTYHYHASPEYNLDGQPHRPYYLGCLGPSKGRCNATVSPSYDSGANWCGEGCGAELCVQPGTPPRALHEYVRRFDPSGAWLDNFTVNDYWPHHVEL